MKASPHTGHLPVAQYCQHPSQHPQISIPTSASLASGWVLCITFPSLISEALNRDSALALSI